jgi:RimJ/RimL family protein N-acetyltransferase
MNGPPLTGRRTRIEPLRDGHFGSLFDIARADALRGRWPLGGRSWTLATFREHVWSTGEIQFVILAKPKDAPIGLLSAYQCDYRSGTAHLALFVEPELWRAGWPLEGLVLFVGHLFSVCPLRKLYLDVPEYNLPHLGGQVGLFLRQEGVLKEHTYCDGKYQDETILSLSKEDWDRDFAARITGHKTTASAPSLTEMRRRLQRRVPGQ